MEYLEYLSWLETNGREPFYIEVGIPINEEDDEVIIERLCIALEAFDEVMYSDHKALPHGVYRLNGVMQHDLWNTFHIVNQTMFGRRYYFVPQDLSKGITEVLSGTRPGKLG